MADETKKTSRYEEEIPEFDRTKLKNADLNISQYWDDSSAKYYEDPTLWWGENAKYEWEWVKNTLVAYNPDATLENLGEYKYWQAAQMANSEQANYITNRNDQIASALYNAWLTSKDDVANYLSEQEWWNYSTEDERQNTINSIWKRLGSIASENDKSDDKEKQADALNRMESDFSNNWWVIYGKVTWEKGNPVNWIETAVDENAVLNKTVEDRLSDLKALMSMSSSAIAASEISWTIPYGETAMRDLAQYYPEKFWEIQAERKKILAQMNVNAITNGEELPDTNNWKSTTNNEIADFANSNSDIGNTADILKSVHDTLSSNQSANNASNTMDAIESDMASLKNRLKNLRKEANQIFKWDVPEYIVNAYINNKSQEIQNELSILEDRYNAAYTRYRWEVADAQWEKEYQLKKEQLQLERDELALKEYQIKNWISSTKDNWTSKTNPWDKFQVTTLSDKEVSDAVDLLYSMLDRWQLGNAQCWVWIQRYYLPMLWISISGISSLEWKKSLINEDEWYMPKKWDLIIINSGAKLEDWTPAWHIGIVLEVHNDWTVEYMDWNGKSDEKPAVNGININSKSILWYRNVNKWQWQNSWWWTDYDYTRFEQYRDTTSKSEKETIAAEYWTDVQWMNNIVRDALTNRDTTSNIPDYSDKEWTDVDYDNFSNFLNSSNKDISNTDRESIAEMYWFKWNLPWMREFARIQLANRPEVEEPDGSIRFKKYENWFNPSLIQAFENFWTTKMSDPQFKSMLKTNRLTEEEFWQQRDNYFNYKQIEFDEAWLEILNKIADFQIAMDDKWKIKYVDGEWIFDKNWLWNSWFGWWPAKATFDAMTNEQLLNKYVQARSSWVTFWSTTEAEWDIMKATNALEKTIWFLSSDKDFTNAYKSYLHWVWEQTMKKPFSNEEWDSFWMTRKMNRDNVNISSTNGGVKNNPPKPTTTPNAPIVPNAPSWTQWTWWKPSLWDL